MKTIAVVWLMWAAPLLAFAQSGQRPDPADPVAAVPPATYRSAFAGYKALGETPLTNWREANDEVGRIGGWRAYLREAQQPEVVPGVPGAPLKPAAGAMHPGHGGHGAHGTHGGGK